MKNVKKTIKKITPFCIDFGLQNRPKIDPKIDKNSIKKLIKTRCEKRSEKERKRAQLKRPSARKPDLAGERKAYLKADGSY